MKNSSNKAFGTTVARCLVVVLCLVAAQGAAGAARGVCVSAEIEESFRLPDGSSQAAQCSAVSSAGIRS